MTEIGKSTEAAKEVKIPSGITLRSVTIVVLQIILAAICNLMLQSTTIWYVYTGFLPLPMTVTILIMWLISRAMKSGKMIFSRQEITVIALGSNIVAAHYYIFTGQNYWGIHTEHSAHLFTNAIWAYINKPEMVRYLPPGALPSESAIEAFLTQGPLNWGEWIGSPFFWSALLVAVYILNAHFNALFFLKPLIDIEALPYTPVQGHIYLINSATKPAKGRTIPELFDFGVRRTRMFWIGIILGILLIVPELISFYVLREPPKSYVGTWIWDFRPYLSPIFPGAMVMFRSYYSWTLLMYLAPLHVSFTAWFGGFIFFFLYQWLGVMTGILPYDPAAERSYAVYAYNVGPFKYGIFLRNGLGLGIAIWFFYRHRDYFRDSFLAFLGKKEMPEEPGGMTHRQVWTGFIITNLISLSLLSYLGAPPHLVFSMLLFNLLFAVALSEMMAYTNENIGYSGMIMPYLWDIGTATGVFTTAPSPTREVMWTMWGTSMYMGAFRVRGWCPERTVFSYKLARDTGTRFWDVFIVSMIAAIVSIPVAYFNGIWQQHIIPTNWGIHNFHSTAYFASPPYNVGEGEHWWLTILGVITCIAIYMIRARFSWFPLHPAAWAMVGWFPFLWFFPGLIAWIAKYLTLKIGGVRIYETYGFPIVIGVLFGYGIGLMLLFISVFFSVSLPAFMSALASK